MYKHNPTRRVPATAAAPVPDWSKLSRHDHVEVCTAGGAVMSGTIDMIAADRSVFWMIRNDGAGRTMLCSCDDVAVTKVPQERTVPRTPAPSQAQAQVGQPRDHAAA